MHQEIPFEELKVEEIKEVIVDQASRPKIEYHVPSELGNLIRECWHSSKEKRPNFASIVRSVRKIAKDYISKKV